MGERFAKSDGTVTFGEPASVNCAFAYELGKRSTGGERGERLYQRPDGNWPIGIGPILFKDLARTNIDHDVIDIRHEREREQRDHGFRR